MKKINIAIMGLGTVGGGTYQILTKNREVIRKNHGVDIQIKRVLEKNLNSAVEKGVPREILTSDLNDILKDDSISIVVEVIGGVEPAKTFMLKCLNAGKNVVTANKELLSKEWEELEKAAMKNKVGLYFEASCVGGVPIIRTLFDSMQANNVTDIMGIINGTTNFILTKMSDEGLGFEDALKQAQALGFAEADPTADVEGFDAMYKLSILSSLAFHRCVPYDVIYREGISKVTKQDIAMAKELGYAVKLLAIASRKGNTVEARVHPTFVPADHPIANVRGSFNAVFLHGDFVDDIMLYGRGAGAQPTGSAIVSDIVFCANQKTHRYTSFKNEGVLSKDIKLSDNYTSKYYISVKAADRPGVLGKMTAVLGKNKVSIHSVIQRGAAKDNFADIIFMTHMTQEKYIRKAVAEVAALSGVGAINSLIRVI